MVSLPLIPSSSASAFVTSNAVPADPPCSTTSVRTSCPCALSESFTPQGSTGCLTPRVLESSVTPQHVVLPPPDPPKTPTRAVCHSTAAGGGGAGTVTSSSFTWKATK